ncbi:MAG: hypothetical protein ACYDB2_09200 [Acidimicrobiales bacterium]
MFKLKKSNGLVLVGTVVLLGGTFIVASGATGHHTSKNSDDDGPEITRTIAITASGGTGVSSADLAFTNLLPGTPQTVTLHYKNTGTSSEDVYLVFSNATALSALNSLGQYGQVHLSSTGAGALGGEFDSSNLNDNLAHCGYFSSSGCWPLLKQYEIARNLGPTSTGSFSFGFTFATAYSMQAPAGTTAYWNAYPVSGQTTIVSSDGSGAGLPYELVATQPGITPGQRGTIAQEDPFRATVTSDDSGLGFHDQLQVRGSSGQATFVVTTSNSSLLVSPTGAITTVGGPLLPGAYSVSGTDSDSSSDIGTWSYTLTVTGRTTNCSDNDANGGDAMSSNADHGESTPKGCNDNGGSDQSSSHSGK